MSLFTCPLCASPLDRAERSYTCPNGHCFDVAKEGYVHLLPANKKHSKSPGDDKGMVTARNQFLSRGYYAPLRDALCALALKYTGPQVSVLDSGCGEGYYTAGIHAALTRAGREVRLAGIDLSKPSVRLAAKRVPEGEFAVASAYHLPVADRSVDLLLNCFSPPGPGGIPPGAPPRRALPLCSACRQPPVGAQAGALRHPLPQPGAGHPL